jgi:hypothetical protein
VCETVASIRIARPVAASAQRLQTTTRASDNEDAFGMAAQIGPPTRSRRFIKLYLVTWALLAVGALAYLATLALQPAGGPPAKQQAAKQQAAKQPAAEPPDHGPAVRAMAKALADMGHAMRRSFTQVQKDVSLLKQGLEEREAQDKAVTSRLAALEQRVTAIDAAQAAAAEAAKAKAADKTARKARPARKAPHVINVPQADAGGRALAKTAPPLETGSIAPTSHITFGEAVVKPSARAAYAVQLAAGPSLQGLRQSWGQLVERHATALATLQPRVVAPRTEGGAYRLLAGPIETKADADRVCAEMGVGRGGCFVTAYTGTPL